MQEVTTEKKLKHKQYLSLARDYRKAAKAVNLVYVCDSENGITRVKEKNGFAYFLDSQPLTNEADLQRIQMLVLPPAWEQVWICARPDGHIQATGFDAKHRKQYRYHAAWNSLRNETKFHRLHELGKALPLLRLRLEKDLSKHGITAEKVTATVISLMERTYIRIGNQAYEKQNGSYGLTTLKDRHVKINGAQLTFSFKGKKGVYHDVSLHHKKLAHIVKQCRDIPGKELFQYYDDGGQRKHIDSGMVNAYLKEATGTDFTAKDIRTWAGTLTILRAFTALGEAANATQVKHNIVAALNEVSNKLGNTRTVCKKYYVHPSIINLYEQNHLGNYVKELDAIEKDDDVTGLTQDEQVLMRILKKI